MRIKLPSFLSRLSGREQSEDPPAAEVRDAVGHQLVRGVGLLLAQELRRHAMAPAEFLRLQAVLLSAQTPRELERSFAGIIAVLAGRNHNVEELIDVAAEVFAKNFPEQFRAGEPPPAPQYH